MVSSTLLTLIVIPAVYALVKGWRLPVNMGVRQKRDSLVTA
jgi:copper/silver efflux system protein